MNAEFTRLFDRMVVRHFGPLAKANGLSLREIGNGIYEMSGREFGLRIRYGKGHRNDFLITLLPIQATPRDLDDLRAEIGLGIVAEFNGAAFEDSEIRNEKDADAAFALAAASSKSFIVPYLVGERSDFSHIRQFVEEKIQRSGVREKKYRFPPNVKQEWIPPEN